MNGEQGALPIEEFIQALTSQLDRAQTAMALKAKFGMPLTFAVKDISLELHAHVEIVRNQVRIRPAEAGDRDASVIRMSFVTITRPMIQESSLQIAPDEPSLREVLGEDVSAEEQRRLEWAGIHSVSQLREVQRQSGESVLEQLVQIPAVRLKAALERASRPHISAVQPEDGSRLRIRGRNFLQDRPPLVRIGARQAQILEAKDDEILVTALDYAPDSTLVVETSPGVAAEITLDANRPAAKRNGVMPSGEVGS